MFENQAIVFCGEKKLQKNVKKVAKKFGGKEKVRIFAARLRNNGQFIDNIERD